VILTRLRFLLLAVLLLTLACSRLTQQSADNAKPKPGATQPSAIKVEVSDGGPVVLTTSAVLIGSFPAARSGEVADEHAETLLPVHSFLDVVLVQVRLEAGDLKTDHELLGKRAAVGA
jgi:hypothetical protein